MPDIKHCRVVKPFDRYDNPGALASLSEGGFARLSNGKMSGHVELLCTEKDNGDILDAAGAVVLTSKDRKGAPIDPFTVVETSKAKAKPKDREEKTGTNTRT